MTEKQKIELYAPCYDGSRFDEHRFPIDLVDDLLMLKNMTIEMAKAIYLERNPERLRIPRNFTNGISIELESIESGSTIPKLVLITAMSGMFPQSNTDFFMAAPERIKNAIQAAHLNQDFTGILPNQVLNYFNQLGSNLKEDERIVFGDKASSTIVLDKESRKRLVLAASKAKEYSGPYEIRGIITALDKDRKTFEIQTVNGSKIKGDYLPHCLEILQSTFNEMELGKKAFLKGTGTYNALDKLMKIDILEETISLDLLDVPARLEELTQLTQGWLDGEQGETLDLEGAQWLGTKFDQYYDSENLPLPATFPTPEGNIQFEWSINNHEVSVNVDLISKLAEFYTFNIQNKSEIAENLDLKTNEAWVRLNQLIRGIHG
ncbi:MAG: hypothetical protein ACK5C0_04085 [Candidatus Kapaibacterium sp.]|jgi:hypothetical protein